LSVAICTYKGRCDFKRVGRVSRKGRKFYPLCMFDDTCSLKVCVSRNDLKRFELRKPVGIIPLYFKNFKVMESEMEAVDKPMDLRSLKALIGKRVNLKLRDGSVYVNVKVLRVNYEKVVCLGKGSKVVVKRKDVVDADVLPGFL